MFLFPRWIVFVLIAIATVEAASQEVLRIRITQGREGAQPIAVAPFGWNGTNAVPPQRIGEIIADDLARSGRFEPVPFADMPAEPTEASQVDFRDFRLLGTPSLVIGNVRELGDGRYSVQFRLFDVFRAEQIVGFEEQASADELRRTAHQIADIVYRELTGERGAFDTRIAYVTETVRGDGSRRYALRVADSDGHNPARILESGFPVMSPAWSPDGERLAYVSFEGGTPSVFVQALETGARERISSFPGINGAPTFSPDGSRLALTLSKDGNPEVYVLWLKGRRLQRLTANAAIDTEPSWSPDGEWLVFTSDRGGRPNIYRIPATGGTAQRLTFEGTYNARAELGPSGERMAIVHGDRGRFRIAVQDLGNNALRVLTDGQLDESPSFAPNGSMILYATSDSEGAALAAVSVDGTFRHRLGADVGAVREPAWGPFRSNP